MLPYIEEDIFGNDSIKLVLRYGPKVEQYFDKENNVPFLRFLEVLRDKERLCYFLKKDEQQHKIIIPMPEPAFGGQLEIVAQWDHTRNAYEIKVYKKKQTRYNAIISTIDQNFSIEQTCELVFLDSTASYTDFSALGETYNLYQRVSKLEIAPATQIENERELWTKFIYAQELQIQKLSEPFDCKGMPTLTPVKNKNGEVTRYKVVVPIESKIVENEYEELISECREVFGEDIYIDPRTGKAEMTEKQVLDVDTILQKKLQDKYERVSEMVCILPIEQLDIKNVLIRELRSQQRKCYVDYCKEKKDVLLIWANYVPIPPIPEDIRRRYKLEIAGIFCKYTKRDEYGNEFNDVDYYDSVTASERDAKNKARLAALEREKLIAVEKYVSVNYTVGGMYSYDYKVTKFDDDFWNNLQREFYGSEYTFSKKSNTISFEFSSFEQLSEKIGYLTHLNLFRIRKNPLEMKDFRFKVSFKSVCDQATVNRREKLKNVTFVAVLPDGKKTLPIGSLNGYESNDGQLVFNMPYLYSDDKKIAKDSISYLGKEDSKGFKCVHADLRGEKTKTQWLREAIDKLSVDSITSTQPNAKPINPRLRDFIFDSSKASPTYTFEFNDIKETEEYQSVSRRQLLMLNDSQLLSVVKALYASDLCLLQGPPGTGKTTVIAELIWQHIMKDSLSHILVTSETNLAVDNALEKLMNGRNVPERLSRYLTIVKPLRFGKSAKFEEEGKRFSVERIEKWIDDEYEEESQYENEMSSIEDAEGEMLDDDASSDDYSHNAVQDWMNSIAARSDKGDSRYEGILKEYASELRNPSTSTKRYFRDKYFKYANVIGSTCSSTGSPAFAMDFVKVHSQQRCDFYLSIQNYKYTIGDIRELIRAAADEENGFSRTAREIIDSIKRNCNIKKDKDLEALLSDPTEDFKRFLFEYELRNLVRVSKSNTPNIKKRDDLLNRLGFDSVDDFWQFYAVSFGTVIMDEASKATPPDLVLPLCFGKKAIVIGDHRQLPPMLNDKDFKSSLYELNDDRARTLADEIDREFTDTSQFARLILNPRLSPTIKSVFTIQYRMHPQINDVISQFYHNDEGGLHCGLDELRVDSPDLCDKQSRYHGFEHIGFISKDVHTMWVRVDGPEQRADSGALYNDAEVVAVKRVLAYLKHAQGFDEYMTHWEKNVSSLQQRTLEQEVGIISFYSKQVSRLREAKAYAKKLGIYVKLNTVDKFQGMERNIVIVSTVRSRRRLKNGNIVDNYDSGFAKTPERLNVALSRAKRLLIVVGDDEFFDGVKDRDGNFLYRNVINEIQKHSEVIDYKSLSKYDER